MLPQKLIDRFHSKTLKASGGCILWTAGRFKDGYGGFWVLGKMRRAHRIAWELVNGMIKDDAMQVLHQCDNPICVNPDHLFLGTITENMKDRDQKGRGLSGERANPSKLKAADVIAIRESKLSAVELGKHYGVAWGTIHQIRRRDTWKEI